MAPEHVVIAPLLAALATAVVTLLVRPYGRLQRAVSVLGGLAYLGGVAVLFERVTAGGPLVYQLSNWDAPFGIVLVADALAVFMLGLAAVVSLAALVFSVWYLDTDDQRLSYHALFHFMLVGVTGSFLTGDLFNLFVWFEVMLMSSYVLVVFYSGAEHTKAALQYAVLNLVGSAVMLLAIGGIYSVTGTLNMADIARRLAAPAEYGITESVPAVLGLSAVLFAVFALKAGVAPFQFWVPAAYRAAPAPVTAVLAGVVKKVGIYAMVRLYFTVFAAATLPVSLPFVEGSSFLAFFGPVMFLMAVASILLGGISAVNQPDVDGLLAYSSIGQVGFIVLPLAVAATVPDVRVLGITAALVYSLNHALAKGLLFLGSGATFRGVGSGRFADLGGLSERDPVLAGAFFVGALSLIGIPPLSGFFGKFLVFDVGVRAGSNLVLGAALVGAILTIAYFSRAWNRAFWGPPVEYDRRPALVAVVVVLAVVVVAVGIGFDPVFEAATRGAEAAVNRSGYVDAVLGVNR
ncbi:complex I subunit 5 family protein [Halorarius litoreus]|uniref:complex I subunit 5 family protein n=1 Tax=Halorarius litoreus TaxID=2962676 RepID=UPI0020CC03CF|nr:proton-conducting transporter membrane subunit [Halorarius litoreus]